MNEIYKNRKLEKLDNPDTYNSQIRAGWLPFWGKNAAENYSFIKATFEKENKDAGALTTREHHDSVLIIGSGPSLNDIEPYLKDWEGDIMCSSSHLAFFEALGITPTYCFIIDADPTQSFLVTEANTKDVTLVTHPNMDPVILKAWQGDVRYFRMHDPGDEYFSQIMPIMYSEFMDYETQKKWSGVNAYVLNAGNVTNTQINVAHFYGYKSLFLCGVDLSFPNDQYRFLGYKRTEDGFEKETESVIPENKPLKKGMNGLKTDQVSCFYKYSTMILWGMDCPEIYSCSRGILTDIPYIPPADVVASQGTIAEKYKIDNDTKYKIAQQYLRYRGIYIMKGKPSMKVKPIRNYEKTKKRIIWWMLFSHRIRGKLTPEVKKQIIDMMQPSPKIKFRLIFLEWEFSETEKKRTWLGYTGITNKYAEKGWKRVKVVVKFNLGRMLKLW